MVYNYVETLQHWKNIVFKYNKQSKWITKNKIFFVKIEVQVSACNIIVIVTYLRKEEQNAKYFTKRDFNRSVKNGLPVSALEKSVR